MQISRLALFLVDTNAILNVTQGSFVTTDGKFEFHSIATSPKPHVLQMGMIGY